MLFGVAICPDPEGVAFISPGRSPGVSSMRNPRRAPKGRDSKPPTQRRTRALEVVRLLSQLRPFRATGLFIACGPRASPWADELRHFVAKAPKRPHRAASKLTLRLLRVACPIKAARNCRGPIAVSPRTRKSLAPIPPAAGRCDRRQKGRRSASDRWRRRISGGPSRRG